MENFTDPPPINTFLLPPSHKSKNLCVFLDNLTPLPHCHFCFHSVPLRISNGIALMLKAIEINWWAEHITSCDCCSCHGTQSKLKWLVCQLPADTGKGKLLEAPIGLVHNKIHWTWDIYSNYASAYSETNKHCFLPTEKALPQFPCLSSQLQLFLKNNHYE